MTLLPGVVYHHTQDNFYSEYAGKTLLEITEIQSQALNFLAEKFLENVSYDLQKLKKNKTTCM